MGITDYNVEEPLQGMERRETTTVVMKGASTRPILTVMADFGMSPFLWFNRDGDDSHGVGGNCCDASGRCHSHPMSDPLFEAFTRWAVEYETAPWAEGSRVDPDDLKSDVFVHSEMILDWPDFHARGFELAKRLKDEVGAAFRVIYEKPIEDPACHEDERREVLDEGSVVLLPSRTMLAV